MAVKKEAPKKAAAKPAAAPPRRPPPRRPPPRRSEVDGRRRTRGGGPSIAMRSASALPLTNVQQDVQQWFMESSRVGFLGDAAEP